MSEKAMLNFRSVLAGCAAVVALYISLYVYLLYKDLPPAHGPRVFGIDLLVSLAKAMLLWPPFWLGAVAVFVAAAYLVKK